MTLKTIRLPANAYPSDLALSDDGDLWVTESSVSAVARVAADGTVTQFRIPGSSNNPSGILAGPDGRMWFVGFQVIGRVDDAGDMTGWEGRAPGLPVAFTIGPDNAVWYTNDVGPRPTISRVSDGTAPATVTTLPVDSHLFPARGITLGPDRTSVWFSQVADSGGQDAIGRVDADGVHTSWPLAKGTVPQTLVAGPDGAVWFTRSSGIGRITADGKVTSHLVTKGQHPNDLVPGTDGALWFTTDTRIGRITTDGKARTWPVPGAKALNGILPARGGGFWLLDAERSVIREIKEPAGPE
ncbi:hydrolase [Streptomyces phyllanthi]|uniref:Hydrolase n=1 Tax=Streptomyces phyllanthi TaxID=1803180 RepID=A0A5N8W323_9ACTN|nr:hydrolase [Streptomyces phyllanthi]MPY40555.1 hydrolase [Streptomyces phyllanthi]